MTAPTLEERLSKDSVVLGADERERTGAHAMAPDHVVRPAHRAADKLPARGIALGAEAATIHGGVQEFLSHQSELLDRKQWSAYVDLFTDDGVYWMPASADQASWIDEPSIFAEDKALMQVRTGRLTHPNAWSQAPVWLTSHIVGNIVLEDRQGADLVVRSRFHVVELRRDATRHFAGSYRHVLRGQGGDFKILLQRVDLINRHAAFDYVIQAWV